MPIQLSVLRARRSNRGLTVVPIGFASDADLNRTKEMKKQDVQAAWAATNPGQPFPDAFTFDPIVLARNELLGHFRSMAAEHASRGAVHTFTARGVVTNLEAFFDSVYRDGDL